MALARLPCDSVPSTTSRVRATATAHAPARVSLRPVPRPSLVVLMRGTPTDEGMQSEEVRFSFIGCDGRRPLCGRHPLLCQTRTADQDRPRGAQALPQQL